MRPLNPTYAVLERQGRRPTAPRAHHHHWWVGLITILFFSFCGTGLAVAIQAGMTFHYPDAPQLFNTIFVYMGFPGRFAQFLYDGGTPIPTMEQRYYGEHLCIAVNAVAYTVFLLAWFLRPGDNRIRRYDSAPGRNPWRHLAD